MGVDEELLDGFARDPSDAAFLAIYERHAPAMYALAVRLMGGRASDAADALQDAWTRAWPRFSAFRRDSSLRTWLCGFIVNCCRERFREPLAIGGADALFHEVSERPAAPTAASRELAIDLERALASLPAGYRAVIVLHDIEGHTHREIASLLGIDEGTSKSQLSRGRQVLRQRLRSPAAIPVRLPSRGQT